MTRPRQKRAEPVHLTWRLVRGLPSLRAPELMAVLRGAFESGCERFGFRLVHFSVQTDHLHLIAEVEDRVALTRGMKGLGVRIARRLNKLLERRGRVIADRYHACAMTCPPQVRAGLRYVLNNSLKHGRRCALPDPCSSGPSFDGWRDGSVAGLPRSFVAAAESWLLTVGWRQAGRIGLEEVPVGSG